MSTPVTVVMLIERLEVGGIETAVWSLLHGVSRARYHIVPWFLAGAGESFERMHAALPETRFLNITTYHQPGPIWRLARELRAAGAQLVHGQGYFAGACGRLVAPWLGLPWVYSLHSAYVDTYRRRNYWMERWLARSRGMVIACSDSVRAFAVERCGVPPDKASVVYNGVDVPQESSWPSRETARAAFGVPAEAWVIGTVARLTAGKNVQLVLRAVAGLPTSCHVLVIGDGPERPALAALAQQLGLHDRAHFVGALRDVTPAYRALDVYVQPSRTREGFSIALTEAMAHRVPVVATAVGGMVEIVTPDTGWLVPPDDVEVLQWTLQAALGDRPRLTQLGAAGRARYLQCFTASQMARGTEAVYEQLLRHA